MPFFNGEASIRKAGFDANGKVSLEISPPGEDYVWHPVPANLQKEYLSIALTAITANKRVFCTIGDSSSSGAEVRDFGIVK
jgi:hypothetical protein